MDHPAIDGGRRALLVDVGAVVAVVSAYPSPPVVRPERPSVLGPPHLPLFMSLLVLRN